MPRPPTENVPFHTDTYASPETPRVGPAILRLTVVAHARHGSGSAPHRSKRTVELNRQHATGLLNGPPTLLVQNRSVSFLALISLSNVVYRGACMEPLGASNNGMGVMAFAGSAKTTLYLLSSPYGSMLATGA